jgi:hypothetical protein
MAFMQMTADELERYHRNHPKVMQVGFDKPSPAFWQSRVPKTDFQGVLFSAAGPNVPPFRQQPSGPCECSPLTSACHDCWLVAMTQRPW